MTLLKASSDISDDLIRSDGGVTSLGERDICEYKYWVSPFKKPNKSTANFLGS